MDLRYLEITGGKPLYGEIKIQGSKNAVLPVLTSCILGEGTCRIENCPRISDVDVTLRLLEAVGCRVRQEGNTVSVDSSSVCSCSLPGAEAARIRSSVLFLGALTARCKRAVLPLPGGCAIGKRPVNLHISALKELGVRFTDTENLTADGEGLCGGEVRLAFPSVGATENVILAAATARGVTVIRNGAQEPEIDELCGFLNLRGARIRREPDGSIWIEGVERLRPADYEMKADRIVAGTYLFAAAAAGGRIRITNFPRGQLASPVGLLKRMGAVVRADKEGGCLFGADAPLRAVPYLETAPYPGFPTDLQSPLVASLICAKGRSCIRETIFENRFRVASELAKFGADLRVDGDRVMVCGVRRLRGTFVEAPDLRSGAALVIAGLCAGGVTRIGNVQYVERGYEDICRDLGLLGAGIRIAEEK